MTGYQNFAKLFGTGRFIRSHEIKKKYSLKKALSSVYIIPAFFRSIYYIPTAQERKGHFIQHQQDFFTNLFNTRFGKNKWYWALSTAARYYGIEWSATKILEIVIMEKSKTINLSEKITSYQQKTSYRSNLLADYYRSLDVNVIYMHKGEQKSLSSIKIDGVLGPVCTKEQLFRDVETYLSKTREENLKRIYQRILTQSK